jgi:penicillin-binding protein 2
MMQTPSYQLPPQIQQAMGVAGGGGSGFHNGSNGMMGTMSRGTGRGVGNGAIYSIAGKTGTAQVFSVGANEKYVEKNVSERLRDHSWFIAFAPVEKPRIALVVLVENGGFGAAAAGPIARKVLDAYLLPQLVAAAPAVTAALQAKP